MGPTQPAVYWGRALFTGDKATGASIGLLTSTITEIKVDLKKKGLKVA